MSQASIGPRYRCESASLPPVVLAPTQVQIGGRQAEDVDVRLPEQVDDGRSLGGTECPETGHVAQSHSRLVVELERLLGHRTASGPSLLWPFQGEAGVDAAHQIGAGGVADVDGSTKGVDQPGGCEQSVEDVEQSLTRAAPHRLGHGGAGQ